MNPARGFRRSGEFVFALELLDTAGRIDNLLRTGEEGVALVTDIYGHLGFVRTDYETVSARACHFALHILWMYTFFHIETFFEFVYFSMGNQPIPVR
jgi:hypothetical protein